MHLWPSRKIRDSFKQSYLNNNNKKKKFEWKTRLTNPDSGDKDQDGVCLPLVKEGVIASEAPSKFIGIRAVFSEALFLLSCCCCCFCCAACDETEN